MEGLQRNYLMVRAMGQQQKEFDVFFGNSVVALGWSDIDFSKFADAESVAAEVEAKHLSDQKYAPTSVGKWLAQVRRFKNIRSGDRILVPYYESVCLATATGAETYDPRVAKSLDLANQKAVQYTLTEDGKPLSIPRSQLSEGLQRRLSVRGSMVADLFEFKEEIEPLFGAEHIDWRARLQLSEADATKKFKSQLLQRMKAGKTNLRAGGLGLERLVKRLLELDGYKAEILAKQTFRSFGDADVQASRADRFSESKLLVQVKHHSGKSDTTAAKQLQEILNQYPAEYADFNLAVVTTAEASEELKTICAENNIVVMDGDDVVDWIFEALPNLEAEWKMKLGIISVPELAVI